jgi:hypothetical protein
LTTEKRKIQSWRSVESNSKKPDIKRNAKPFINKIIHFGVQEKLKIWMLV